MSNAHIKRTGLDKYGVPLESNEGSFEAHSPQFHSQSGVAAVNRAQTSNQGFRKYTNFFKLSRTAQPSIDFKD